MLTLDHQHRSENSRRVVRLLALMVSVAFLIDALFMSWGARPFLYAYFGNLLASVLYWGQIFATFAAGIAAGIAMANRSGRTWLGWVVGILVAGIVSLVIGSFVYDLPNVGWRIERTERGLVEMRFVE